MVVKMSVAAFLVLFTIESGILLLYLSYQVYRRKNILGQSYFWVILLLLGLICLLLGSNNLGSLFPDLGPYPVSEPLGFITVFLGHLITTIWFLFCLLYTGRSRYLTRPIIGILLGYTVLGNLAFQLFQKYGFSTGISPLDTALWLFGMSAYIKCCILFLWGVILLVRNYKNVSEQFRHQIIVLVGGACLVVILVTVFDSNIIPDFNPVGVHFAITGFIFAFGILYNDLLTFSPVFREQFFGYVEPGLIVLNEKLQILDMNPSAEELLQVSLDDVFGKYPADLVAADDFKEILSHPDQLMNASPVSVHTHDQTSWYRISVQHDERNIGAEQVYLFVITDITHNITLEKEIAEAQAQIVKEKEKKRRELMYREFFRSHRDAIVIVSEGFVVDCNTVALNLFKKNRDEIIGSDPCLLSARMQGHHDDVPDKLKFQISRAAAGELVDFPWVFQSGDTGIETEVRLNRLMHEHHILVEMSIRDMSELCAEKQNILRENEILKETLANDLQLWNRISQVMLQNTAPAGMNDQQSLEEIIRTAYLNIRQAYECSGEEEQPVFR